MAQINFPPATQNGQTFEAPTGVVYTYVGTPPNGYWSGTFQSPVLTDLDTRYLKLDASNDPITGDLYINSNVGVNTSSPGFNLDVDAQIRAGADTGYGFLGLGKHPSQAWKNWHVVSEANGYLSFFNGNNGAGTRHMTLGSNGNVGIGTDIPDRTLDVRSGDNNSSRNEVIKWARPDGAVNGALGTGIAAGNGVFIDAASDHPLAFQIGGDEKMRISSNGTINYANCPTFADDSAAGTGGLVAGDIYKTSAGDLKIKL